MNSTLFMMGWAGCAVLAMIGCGTPSGDAPTTEPVPASEPWRGDGETSSGGGDAASGVAPSDRVEGTAAPAGVGDASDAAGYDPCPASPIPCRIMPLGDSITYGYQSTTMGGYRSILFDAAFVANRSITFVGSLTSGPPTVDGVTFPQENEGHTGYTIDTGGGRPGLQPLVQGAIATYQPDIVTLMVGTNDVDIQLDLANAPARLGRLIDTILDANPDLLLVVAQITPTQDDAENARVKAYNAAIPGLVAARASSGKHILLVDMYGAFTADPSYKSDYMANPLHPNDAGCVLMGRVWYAAIGAFFH
jgi:lysophospholipase L1-like esterase